MIKARVTSKTDIKTWANAKNEGRLFSCNLIDETGEIRMTGFTDSVDKFYDMIDVGKVYFISNAAVKVAKRQFNNVKNDYEIHLDQNSVIQLVK
jgi:replication factor A1